MSPSSQQCHSILTVHAPERTFRPGCTESLMSPEQSVNATEPHKSSRCKTAESECKSRSPCRMFKSPAVASLSLKLNTVKPKGPAARISLTPKTRNRHLPPTVMSARDPGHRLQKPLDTTALVAERVARESAYLQNIATIELANARTPSGMKRECEELRLRMQAICRNVISSVERQTNPEFPKDSVQLLVVGSLRSNLAIRGAMLDLVLTSPKSSADIAHPDSPICQLLTRTLLLAGYGVMHNRYRRTIAIRGCDRPDELLFDKLVALSLKDQQPLPTPTSARGVVDQGPPLGEGSDLSFESGMGIRFRINLSTSIDTHSTSLLRCYGLCDRRIREMVRFVKIWAEARGIASPQHGTLSGYAWALLVLHYCVNVASPALAPNLQLQLDARRGGAPSIPTEHDGLDIRFWRDDRAIADACERGQINHNHDSLGTLLRGFFGYYSGARHCHGAPSVFHWVNDVVTLSCAHGLMTKESKGWSREAARLGPIRDRHGRFQYTFLCIEDPFDKSHNVSGNVSLQNCWLIRNELRRAAELTRSCGQWWGQQVNLLEKRR